MPAITTVILAKRSCLASNLFTRKGADIFFYLFVHFKWKNSHQVNASFEHMPQGIPLPQANPLNAKHVENAEAVNSVSWLRELHFRNARVGDPRFVRVYLYVGATDDPRVNNARAPKRPRLAHATENVHTCQVQLAFLSQKGHAAVGQETSASFLQF